MVVKRRQKACNSVFDKVVEDQQSEMYRDALFKEKRLREESDKKSKGG
ncbi:MAG: hypothetical protein ACKPKO_29530 [Candidatus Fonsibacter sp.]